MELKYGIRDNAALFLHLLLQVLLVGLTLGLMRTVVPALAESEYGVPRDSFTLLTAFVVAFGLVKGAMNFIAGRLSERWGRRRILMFGWIVALPIPLLIYFAPSWDWIVIATVLLGVNQGMTWSMTQTSQLDITRADQRGLTIGLNEFAGYVGMAAAGVMTGYLAEALGARTALLMFGMLVVLLALLLCVVAIQESRPWVSAESLHPWTDESPGSQPQYACTRSSQPGTAEIFALMSWRDTRMAALCQAGLVEKFVDALIWVFYPVFLHRAGLSLPETGWVIAVYGLVWGLSQLLTGRLSDRVGRQPLNVLGMWVCGGGVALMLVGSGAAWWTLSAAVTGFGMAMLYPNLSAAIADLAHPNWRGSAIGIYRFWRDLGYGIGALGLGWVATQAGAIEPVFGFVALAMFLSGALLWVLGTETNPKLARSD